MKKSDFLKLVQIELDAIKINATKKEINKLNIKIFNHLDSDCCIYGQMTGSCISNRAKIIYTKLYKSITDSSFIGTGLQHFKFSLHDFTEGSNFTPLEKYLFMCSKRDKNLEKYYDPSLKHKQIVSYLKGKINTIKLT